MKFACVVMICMAVLYAQHGEAITCPQVSSNLVPCVTYLQSGGAVSTRCCNGVRNIVSAARTTADRRVTCNCLKSSAAAYRRINQGYAAALPGKCRVYLPFKISTSFNCARYVLITLIII